MRDQLASMTGASFQYDAAGRRQKRVVGSTTREFVYDGLTPVQEKSGSSVIANLFTGLGIDEYYSRTEGSTTRTFLGDALGSTLALTDTAGAVQTQYTYEPFGKTTATGPTNTNTWKFTGREDDGTTLYYYRARYYHPGPQRFVSEDPIGLAGGDVNLYGYVRNNPLRYIDPLGLWTEQAGVTVSGTFGGASGSVFAGFVIDTYGTGGTYWGWGLGGGGGSGISGGGHGAVSNGDNICAIGGGFANASVGGGGGLAGTADFFTGPGAGPGGRVTGGGGTIGLGGGASGSAQQTYTHVTPLWGRKSCN